ncbi:MAG: 5-deoxy-glucuronate isomerase [Planctomycetes bacterium]|nr:5-deoxy-glucuronate isomerase [Planctomycetota bacterium]
MSALPWQTAPGLATAAPADDAATLAVHVQVWRPAERPQLVTGECETAALILHGTFDLTAGPADGAHTAWPARGARNSPFEGRPMAVFLPPHTVFGARGDAGEIALFAARQPAAADPTATGRAALSQSPLLPLAGSGKAFDPGSGEWRPAETFPTAAESLPPRRMQRRSFGEVAVERVFAADYKARTLTVDELVLQPGQSLAIAAIDDRPTHSELLVFERIGDNDRARLVSTPGGAVDLTLAAADAPVYAVVAYLGK